MTRLFAVIERDLKKFRRNPMVIMMSIMMPILYLVILGHSFQGKLQGLPLAVVNQDDGPKARELINNLRAVAAGPRTVELVFPDDPGAAVEGVRRGVYKAALIIPPTYSRDIMTTQNPEIGLFLDNTDAISAQGIQAVVAGALQATASGYVPLRDVPGVVELRGINLYKDVDYAQSLVPGVVIMAIFLGTLTTGAFNLVMDRFLGVDESYMLTPLTKMDIVGGLIISGLAITTTIAVTILIVSMVVTGIAFGVVLGHFPLLLTVIVLTTLSLLSLTFCLLGRLNHPRIVGILSGFLNVILFFPSGAVYPTAGFPGWLKVFARFNPEAYAVHALKSVLFKGEALANVWQDILFLAAFTTFFLTVATLTFKRRL